MGKPIHPVTDTGKFGYYSITTVVLSKQSGHDEIMLIKAARTGGYAMKHLTFNPSYMS
ncbi:hypothetical protein PL9631_660065 [Planktothrix paucivesiculata PCC 9631]|uniref:Uncharacterized protein n=1 Tax=Planktothrix paucivesiculata PCC 9631 TaxID=671071 RepID=A0A7Z9BWL8_9CYAN|nr:hypothetical protein PL9631_660065 [Planktothrix paucivesiculata PCC 9631]